MYQIIGIFSLILLTISCAGRSDEDVQVMNEFRKNRYNFKLNTKVKYKGIHFQLPNHFKNGYSTNYTLSSGAFTRTSFPFTIYFSVERFDESNTSDKFVADFLSDSDLLNSFHDAYIHRRYNSVERGATSIKKIIPLKKGKKGLIQTVGSSGIYGGVDYYAIASIETKEGIYIFQWICSKEIMDYTFDDFERVLKSVE